MGIEEFLLDRDRKEGRAEGIEKGIEEGLEKGMRKAAVEMKKNGIDLAPDLSDLVRSDNFG